MTDAKYTRRVSTIRREDHLHHGAAVEDVLATYYEDGAWWCYYAGLATRGATREDAEREMREWLTERREPPDA